MEGKTNMKKYHGISNRQVSGGCLSPERAKVWTEKSPKYHYNNQLTQQRSQQQQQQLQSQPQLQQNDGKVPVVYYLCRNRQLEHPHFIEVPLSSPDGLYLRGKSTCIMMFYSCVWNTIMIG